MFGAYILYKWGTTETTGATRKPKAQANIIMMNNPGVKSKGRPVPQGGIACGMPCKSRPFGTLKLNNNRVGVSKISFIFFTFIFDLKIKNKLNFKRNRTNQRDFKKKRKKTIVFDVCIRKHNMSYSSM